jgi:hypothetical protein
VSCIPCRCDAAHRQRIEELAELLKTQAHTLMPDVPEAEFYRSGLLRGAIEYMRGQYSARMADKKDFAKLVLNFLEDRGFIRGWSPAGGQNRYDYEVRLKSGKVAAIELKGCLDGNNTTIFERPAQANEFIIWSVCTNPNADPEKNAWSGIHTRLSAEIIHREVCVDGLVIWDMLCDSDARACPKLVASPRSKTEVGQFALPPPCLYLFPGTVPTPRNNPSPPPHAPGEVEFLAVLHSAFGGLDSEIHTVQIEVRQHRNDVERRTLISAEGQLLRESNWTAIRRR